MRHFAVVALLALVACSGDGPTEPPVAGESVTGKWTAPQVDVFANVTFTLAEQSGSVTGIWTGALIPNHGWSGTATGSRSGTSITLTMIPYNLACDRGYIIEVERNGDTMTGTATMRRCDGSKVGAGYAVTLSR